MAYPLMFRLKQRFRSSTIGDVSTAVEAELANLDLGRKVHPGQSIAVACGSCKIADHAAVLKAVVDHFKGLKSRPFLVPAMEFHAGGTAEGQLRALEMFGITEEAIGAEIRSSMSAEVVGQLPAGVPVYCDRHALAADHIFVVNRVRPHSALDGEVQSGLLKMLATGLGKHSGAEIYHSAVATMPFADLARGVWKVMLDQGRMLAGLMLVEYGYAGLARIQGVIAEEFADAERKALSYARSLCPKLPFRFIDILLVDEVGTTFGCHAVDLNVVGRKQSIHGAAPGESPQIRSLVFRDLDPAALAVTIPSLASIPVHLGTDREILDAALSMTALQPPEKARIVWIRNTSSLDEFECSEPFLEEVTHWNDLSVASDLHPLDFDADGNLRDFVIGGTG